MYKSKSQIEKKLKQVKYAHNLIRKFDGRVLAHNGRDTETGAHPLIAHLSAFVAQARSVIQYANKEAKDSGHLTEYERFIESSEVFRLFKSVRNSDIHEYTIGTHTLILTIAYMSPAETPHTLVSAPIEMHIETVSDLDKPPKEQPHVKVVYTLCRRVGVTDYSIEQLGLEGQVRFTEAVRAGEELYEELELDGIKNLHELCDLYVAELEKFVIYGQDKGFIT